MKQLFISYALERDWIPRLQERLAALTLGAEASGYSTYSHVRDTQHWNFANADLGKVLETVFQKIQEADVILLDLTICSAGYRRVGLNIEGGYAKALAKPIIAVWRYPDCPSMTIELADYSASYTCVTELQAVVKGLLERVEHDLHG